MCFVGSSGAEPFVAAEVRQDLARLYTVNGALRCLEVKARLCINPLSFLSCACDIQTSKFPSLKVADEFDRTITYQGGCLVSITPFYDKAALTHVFSQTGVLELALMKRVINHRIGRLGIESQIGHIPPCSLYSDRYIRESLKEPLVVLA